MSTHSTTAEAPSKPPQGISGAADHYAVVSRRGGGRTSKRVFLSGSAGFLATVFAATAFAVTAAMIVPVTAQQLPHLNVDPVCRGIARHAGSAGERGGPDLSFRRCVASELRIRRSLAQQWSSFSPATRANCVGGVNAGGLPSYTALLTCLQTARAVARMRASTSRKH
jgi:hypothetical protein